MASIYDPHKWSDGLKQQRLSDGWKKSTGEDTPMEINYQDELKRLEELEAQGNESPFLKLKEGQHKIKFLAELNKPIERFFAAENKNITQSDVRVEYEGKEKTWSVPLSKSGVYAQLIKYAAKNSGLAGKTLTIAVKKRPGKDGKQRNEYIVMEALGL